LHERHLNLRYSRITHCAILNVIVILYAFNELNVGKLTYVFILFVKHAHEITFMMTYKWPPNEWGAKWLP